MIRTSLNTPCDLRFEIGDYNFINEVTVILTNLLIITKGLKNFVLQP